MSLVKFNMDQSYGDKKSRCLGKIDKQH